MQLQWGQEYMISFLIFPYTSFAIWFSFSGPFALRTTGFPQYGHFAICHILNFIEYVSCNRDQFFKKDRHSAPKDRNPYPILHAFGNEIQTRNTNRTSKPRKIHIMNL